MSTFYGSEQCVIDAKGRVNVPSRMRRGLDPEAGETFILCRGFDGCVSFFPIDEWRKYTEKLRQISLGDEEGRTWVRLLLESAHESTLDGQGRVTLTKELMAIAGVEKEAKLVGTFDHIELWNAKRYDGRSKAAVSNFEQMARRLFS